MINDPKLILLIEDSGADADLVAMALRKAGFHHPLRRVGDAQQALNYLSGEGQFADRRQFPFPDLVMLDHKIPGEGWPVLEWVRRRSDLSWLPVVIFSGSENPDHQKKASSLGANAYHIKPQRFEDFIDTIRKIIEFWLHRPRAAPKPARE